MREDRGRWVLNNSELVSSLSDTVSDYFYFSLWLAWFSKRSMYFSNNKGKIQLLSTNKVSMDTETPGRENTMWAGRQRLGEVLKSQGWPETRSWGTPGTEAPSQPAKEPAVPHLHRRLRTQWETIPVVHSSQLTAHCHGSPRKLIQHVCVYLCAYV